jgi:hypothetical protein
MLSELRACGIEAAQLVVGDDAGLLFAASEHGFQVLGVPNVVGRRVNDGFEWAAREGGATHVAYCGSDDWHLADYFVDPPADAMRTCAWQAFVSPAGDRLAIIRQTAAAGGAPWIIPAALLEPCGYRPADDRAMRAVDASIVAGLLAAIDARVQRDGHNVLSSTELWRARREARHAAVCFDEGADPLRMVDFKGGGEQITPWARVVRPGGPALELDTPQVFETLATRYPPDLVERMEKFYAGKVAR